MSIEYLAASQAIFSSLAELRRQEIEIEKITLTNKTLEEGAKTGARKGLSSQVEALLAQYGPVIEGKLEMDCLKAYHHSLNKSTPQFGQTPATNLSYQVLDTLVDDLNIPQLSKTALKKDGIYYLGQLAQASEAHLQTLQTEYGKLTVFGNKRLLQLKDELQGEYSLQLGMTIDYKSPYERDPEKYKKIFDTHIDNLGLSTRAGNGLKNDNILYVGQLVQVEELVFNRTPNMGDTSITEIKSSLRTLGPLTIGMANINYKAPNN